MALCFLPVQHEFVIDDFMVIDMGNREYRLCGVTLKGPWAAPNPIPWNRCYALGPNAYITVSPTSVSLLVNGQEVTKTNYDSETIAPFDEAAIIYRRNRRGLSIGRKYQDQSQSLWRPVKAYLETVFETDKNAAMVLGAMERWETTSMETLRWLKNRMSNWNTSDNNAEVLVSGTRWLMHCHGNRWIIGDLGDVWGEAYLSSEQAGVCLAAPIQDGWVIKTEEND